MKQIFITLIITLCFLQGKAQTPVEINGQLHVCDKTLCNQYNNPVQLRGMSSHGIQWYGWGDCLTNTSLDSLAYNWGADILRASLYVQEGGYATDTAAFIAQMNTIIDAATARGMYVLIDWHQLTPGDPNANTALAKGFFMYMADRYGGQNNIIYDVANEPNNVSWAAIKNYAEEMIPVIRNIDPDAVILCGTHGWASLGISDGGSAQDIVNNPVNATNFMYTFHFYAASHGTTYLNELDWASDRLPIFVTEWGSQTASGDGANDFVMTQQYLDLMAAKKISWCNWNYSDDFRTGAVWNTGTCASGNFTQANLKPAGVFVRNAMLFPPDDFQGANCPLVDLGSDQSLCGVSSVLLDPGIAVDGVKTFEWKRNTVTVAGPSTTQNTFSATQAGTYELTVDSGSCSISDEVEVTATLPNVDLGPSQDLCSPAQVTLDAGVSGAGISYSWTKDASPIGGNTQTLIVTEAGNYAVTISASGCSNQQDNVSITSSLPSVQHDTICTAGTANLAVTSGSGSYGWYDQASGGTLLHTGTAYSPAISSNTTYYVEDPSGGATSYQVGRTNNSGSGWNNDPDQFLYQLEFDAIVSLTIDEVKVYAQAPQTVTLRILESDGTTLVGSVSVAVPAGESVMNVGITVPPGTGYLMDNLGSTGNLWLDDNASYPYTEGGVVSITGLTAPWGTENWYTPFYDWKVTVGTACDRVPVTATIDPGHPSCSGGCTSPGTVTLSPSAPPAQCGGSVNLTASQSGTPPAGGFEYEFFRGGISVQGPGSTSTYTALQGGNYTVAVTDPADAGTCNGTSGSVSVTIDANPTTSAAGSDQTLCATSANLNANTPTIGVGVWSVVSGSGSFGNQNNAATSVTGLSVGTNVFRWTITNGTCPASTSDVTITQDEQPTTADAGTNQTLCSASAVMAANTPTVGAGSWIVVSGSGNFGNTSSPTTSVSGLSAGANVFRWTISNGTCTSSNDEVTITRDVPPTTANAGPDQNLLCTNNSQLSANTPVFGTGTWSLVSGTGSITSINDPSSTVTGLPSSGSSVFEWCISNGTCTASCDQVTISETCITGIDETGTDINVYPNPFTDLLTIETEEGAVVTLQTAAGQIIKSMECNGDLQLDTKNISAGIYILTVKTGDSARTMRLVKNN